MVRKTIKTDLKYFKDADVDSLIPLNWGYLAFDRILRKHLKFKRIRYHSLLQADLTLQVFNFFNWQIKDLERECSKTEYKVTIISNWILDFLLRQKKWVWLLQRWKKIKLEIKN